MNNYDNIKLVCKQYRIYDYTINYDMTVDVDNDVYLAFQSIKHLPLKFGKVTGGFNCSGNDLTTLYGSPYYVGKSFTCCYNNKCLSLNYKHLPNIILEDLNLKNNTKKHVRINITQITVGGKIYSNCLWKF